MGELRLVAGRLTLAAAVWLVVGLSLSASVVWGLAEITEGVVEGESRAFDLAVLLWIGANVPDWMGGPMRAVTALGYYSVVLPLLALIVLAFYLRGWKLSAVMLGISTAGGIFLTTVLKGVFRRGGPSSGAGRALARVPPWTSRRLDDSFPGCSKRYSRRSSTS